MRYLGIDIGQRRTGFALGERDLSFVQPLRVFEHANEAGMLEAVDQVVAEQGPLHTLEHCELAFLGAGALLLLTVGFERTVSSGSLNISIN